MPSTFEFCLPTRATSVPDHPVWLHEVKYDGYRLRVERDGNRLRLITRGGHNWADRYPWIVETALKNRHQQFVIDGEAVARPCTSALLRYRPPSCNRTNGRDGPLSDSCVAANIAHYSITSSARPSNGKGTVRPSASAVLRLIISSTFVACCTGRSAGPQPPATSCLGAFWTPVS